MTPALIRREPRPASATVQEIDRALRMGSGGEDQVQERLAARTLRASRRGDLLRRINAISSAKGVKFNA
jgi:hypothetical protein